MAGAGQVAAIGDGFIEGGLARELVNKDFAVAGVGVVEFVIDGTARG